MTPPKFGRDSPAVYGSGWGIPVQFFRELPKVQLPYLEQYPENHDFQIHPCRELRQRRFMRVVNYDGRDLGAPVRDVVRRPAVTA